MRTHLVGLLVPVTLAVAVASNADDDWLEARSEHFTVVTDGGEGRAKDVLEDLEKLRRLIAEILPAQKVEGAKPAIFCLFDDEKSMRPFQPTVNGERAEWAAMYRPTPFRDVVLILGDGSRSRPGAWRSGSSRTSSRATTKRATPSG